MTLVTAPHLWARGDPRHILPAMNLAMWNTPQVQEAVRRLGKEALMVPPLVEEGKAKYPPPEDVVEYVIDATAPRDYEGHSYLAKPQAVSKRGVCRGEFYPLHLSEL